MYLFEASLTMSGHRRKISPTLPKRVTFRVYVHNLYDDDNLRTALKPTRDALKDMSIIDDDRPSSGHEFIYLQEMSRGKDARRGVEITVEALHA